ncbi:hypothetical protein [Streptomyces erythrochromogenes]|uniref:hypothetical protein n=1 Tax=Streptomyces erythrochromogenes TaxID=285574 RepID=UPI0033EE991B
MTTSPPGGSGACPGAGAAGPPPSASASRIPIRTRSSAVPASVAARTCRRISQSRTTFATPSTAAVTITVVSITRSSAPRRPGRSRARAAA